MTIKPVLNLVDDTAQVTVTKSPAAATFTRTGISGCRLIGNNPDIHALSFGIKSLPRTPSKATVNGEITVLDDGNPNTPPELPCKVSASAWFVQFLNPRVAFDGPPTQPKIKMSVEYLPKDAPGVSVLGNVKRIEAVRSSKPRHLKGEYEGDKSGILDGGAGFLAKTFNFSWTPAEGEEGYQPTNYKAMAVMESIAPKGWKSTSFPHLLDL